MEDTLCRDSKKNCDIRGGDFCKYYQRPLHCKPGDIILEPSEEVEFVTCHSYSTSEAKFISKSVQTDYRESETQTYPWDPPFRISKIHDDPEVLSLQHLSFGNGLPASFLELNYIIEERKLKKAKTELRNLDKGEAFEKNTQIICDQVQRDWNYKIAIQNKKLFEKFTCMKSTVIQDLKKQADKKEIFLRNMWARRNYEMEKVNAKLEDNLQRELAVLESKYFTGKKDTNEECKRGIRNFNRIRERNVKKGPEEIDYMLSKYYLSNPSGLSDIKFWLEKKEDSLSSDVPLVKKIKRTPRERVAEKAYESLLDKKRTKLPPKVYRDDYETEETPLPPIKTENVLESPDFVEEKIDMVTVLQQTLRGLAYQKEVLELVERHKDGLSTILPFTSDNNRA